MATKSVQAQLYAAGRIAARQHWVITRAQLVALGFSRAWIRHRVASGRLHVVHAGVFAVGRRSLPREGEWMAAVLRCGEGAKLAGWSAAGLMGLGGGVAAISVAIPRARRCDAPAISVHRRAPSAFADARVTRKIPHTGIVTTMIEISASGGATDLERLVNAADTAELIDPQTLRARLERRAGEPGVPALRRVLDRRTFTLTDSALERKFLPIVRRLGLPLPRTRQRLNGFRVDFYWPELGLVVETDGLRYHRTTAQQARDRLRDQAHSAAGLTPLRFTHDQIAHEPAATAVTLGAVAGRCAARRASEPERSP